MAWLWIDTLMVWWMIIWYFDGWTVWMVWWYRPDFDSGLCWTLKPCSRKGSLAKHRTDSMIFWVGTNVHSVEEVSLGRSPFVGANFTSPSWWIISLNHNSRERFQPLPLLLRRWNRDKQRASHMFHVWHLLDLSLIPEFGLGPIWKNKKVKAQLSQVNLCKHFSYVLVSHTAAITAVWSNRTTRIWFVDILIFGLQSTICLSSTLLETRSSHPVSLNVKSIKFSILAPSQHEVG